MLVGTAHRCHPRNGVQRTARPTLVFVVDGQVIFSRRSRFGVRWLDTALGLRGVFRTAQQLQRAVDDLLIHCQVISPRWAKRIENARRRERFHTMRNIAREVKRVAR